MFPSHSGELFEFSRWAFLCISGCDRLATTFTELKNQNEDSGTWEGRAAALIKSSGRE
jgi:hypothetical protein